MQSEKHSHVTNTMDKSNSKARRLVFTLKDESSGNDSSSSSDDADEIELNDQDEDVPVFEQDPKTGKKKLSKALSYKMSFVEDRIGVKLNLKDSYYDA
jgi:hypothetical protein